MINVLYIYVYEGGKSHVSLCMRIMKSRVSDKQKKKKNTNNQCYCSWIVQGRKKVDRNFCAEILGTYKYIQWTQSGECSLFMRVQEGWPIDCARSRHRYFLLQRRQHPMTTHRLFLTASTQVLHLILRFIFAGIISLSLFLFLYLSR